MQKIIIKNFGPIKEAEIELKKVLILIGEQATGKSTIAKLIYFFKSVLVSEFFFEGFNCKSVENRFKDFFGSFQEDFEVIFYYDFQQDFWLKLKLDSGNLIAEGTIFSKEFLDYIQFQLKEINKLIREKALKRIENEEFPIEELGEYTKNRINVFNIKLNIHQENKLFTIAGRSSTVGYSEFFENNFYADLKIKQKDKILTTDEILMLSFMENVLKLKSIYKKYGGFEGLIKMAASEQLKAKLSLVQNKAEKILKGKYSIKGGDEKIINLNNDSTYLSNSSSGQQEAIRILQDIFYSIYSDDKVLRIIEEPEAHLFPAAQKELIELLALMVNHNENNQLIITTHSPYILTVFNNLLFANRVVKFNAEIQKEVNNIISSEFWLQAEDCSVYSLSQASGHFCQSIFDQEKGTIQQNYLDAVSETLGSDFNALYQIHAQTFKRK